MLICILQIRKYHKKFYRAENLTIIVTGLIKELDILKTLSKFEEKLLNYVSIAVMWSYYECLLYFSTTCYLITICPERDKEIFKSMATTGAIITED